MRTSFLVLASVASMATALPGFANSISKRCETKEVKFHFNDTTIGSVQSCTTDVMDRGGASLAIRADDNTTTTAECTNGPDTTYTVVSGDTLEKIAAEYSSGVCNIAEASDLASADFILLGQVLVVPTNVCEADIDNASCRTEGGTATCVTGGAATYTIVSGDTFFLIASSQGITLDSLVAANPNVDASALQIGQVINIPVC